jgi:hypothetical protein
MLEFAVMPLAAIALPAYFVRKFVKTGQSAGKLIRATELRLRPEQFPQEWRDFIVEHGLSNAGSFQYEATPFTVFHQVTDTTVFRAMVVMTSGGRQIVDFVTEFANDSSLTTSAGNGLGMFPRCEKSYSQGFPNAPIRALFQRHMDGEAFLLNTDRVQISPLTMSLLERLENGVRAQAALVGKTPLYWLKASYWFWVRRFLIANKTVEQLTAEKA